MAADGLLGLLEADLRQLSSETRRAEGFTGWLTGPEHLPVKEAAERAVLKLRSLAGQPDAMAAIRDSKEVLKPFIMGCESKSSKLASIAMVSIQKLSAHDALSDDGILLIAAAMEQVRTVSPRIGLASGRAQRQTPAMSSAGGKAAR